MLYQITMNMPAREGAAVHQIICEHTAESLRAFVDVLAHSEFIIVFEFYKDSNKRGDPDYDPKRRAELVPHGQIGLNTAFIGKVREYQPN